MRSSMLRAWDREKKYCVNINTIQRYVPANQHNYRQNV